jgi:hypothetical protein
MARLLAGTFAMSCHADEGSIWGICKGLYDFHPGASLSPDASLVSMTGHGGVVAPKKLPFIKQFRCV